MDYLAHINGDGERFAEVVHRGQLDAPVPSCPGWDLAALAHHLGAVHRWARQAAVTGARPEGAVDDPPPSAQEQLAEWIVDGVHQLAAALGGVDPDAPTWHPFPVPRVAAVWPRRQAHETAIHRWDAEATAGAPAPIDASLAADGVAEYFQLVVPRLIARDRVAVPVGTLHVHLVDVHQALTISSREGDDVDVAATAPPDRELADILAAPAEDVLLALWGRRPLAPAMVSPVAAGWLALGGN